MKKLVKFIKKGFDILFYRLREQGPKTTMVWVYGRGVPKLTGVPTMQYSQITPDIFVGPQYGPAGKRKLQGLGINAGVNLRIEFDDAAHNLALTEYCYLPTIDDDAPSMEDLHRGVAFIQRIIDEGGKVYIHCAGGVGRAPTMAAAYFISQGRTLTEALTLIKKARPFIKIMPPQMAQLKRFETIQHKNNPVILKAT